MKKSFRFLCFMVASLPHVVLAASNVSGHLQLEDAENTEITLYQGKALVKQGFSILPDKDGRLIIKDQHYGWRENSLSLEYISNDSRTYPEKIGWQKGSLDRDSFYSKLVGKPVELVGGGLNVPVQGELLVYDAGFGLVQGNNGRQYVVDWNDSQGVRLVAREPVYSEKDYTARFVAEFGTQELKGQLQLSYLTPALRYTSQYRLTREANGKARLERQLTLINDSSLDYNQATVRLVAGDSHQRPVTLARSTSLDSANASPEMVDERVGEVLVSQIPEPVDIKSYSNVQLSQYRQKDIPLEKLYVMDIYGRSYGGRLPAMERPKLVLRFKAGADLPAGPVEMYERDQSNSMLLSGNSWIPATIKGDRALLTMGDALAVRVSRAKLDSQQKEGQLQVHWQATIHNDQSEAINFILTDRDRALIKIDGIQGGKQDAQASIKVTVPAKSQKKVTYMANYSR